MLTWGYIRLVKKSALWNTDTEGNFSNNTKQIKTVVKLNYFSQNHKFILDMHFWISDLDIHILYMQTLGLGAQLACRDSPGWTGSRDHLIQPPTQ